jgi:hypothetical protein
MFLIRDFHIALRVAVPLCVMTGVALRAGAGNDREAAVSPEAPLKPARSTTALFSPAIGFAREGRLHARGVEQTFGPVLTISGGPEDERQMVTIHDRGKVAIGWTEHAFPHNKINGATAAAAAGNGAIRPMSTPITIKGAGGVMKKQAGDRARRVGIYGLAGLALLMWAPIVSAADKAEKTFQMVVTDQQGVETELKNGIFYWEEKMSETSFVPHELRHLPSKRGTATVNIKFDQIKQIDIKPGADKAAPAMTVTLTNGKNGEFVPAVQGSFKGESDFGQVEVPIGSVSKVVFK